MLKRILTAAAGLVLLAAMAACGATTTPPEPATVPQSTQTVTSERTAEGDIALPEQAVPTSTPEQADEASQQTALQQAAATQTTTAATAGEFGPLFQKYVRDLVSDGDYTVSMRQSGVTMVTAVSGKDSALESNMAGVLQIRLINQNGNYFMLMPSTKKYAEMTAEDYAKQASSLESTALDLTGVRYRKSGSETIAGKTYQTETYDEEGRGSVTYFFTDAGLQRARVVKDGKTTDVESFTVRDEAQGDLFVIPSDYVKVSDPSQLLT